MLKSISHSGLVYFFLREFVNHYLFCSNVGGEIGEYPPYSLVNQAFAVAVGKVLDGYVSGMDTLLASVRLRRSGKHDGLGVLTSVVNADVTLLEVFLHSEDLRTFIEAVGNICLSKVGGFTCLRDGLTVESKFEFGDFPRGADLLTYLYVLLRDADPGHHALLKYLFVRSCKPYCAFIKSWIYHAKIDDPYGEFFVVCAQKSPESNVITGIGADHFSLASIKERECTSVPYFLKDVCLQLIRAGQQLEVLVQLLNSCNLAVTEDLGKLEEILPFWIGKSINLTSLLNKLTFSRKGMKALLLKREIMYESVLEKLQDFFTKLDVRCQRMHHTVIPFGSLLGRNNGENFPCTLNSDSDLNSASMANEGATHVAAGPEDTESIVDAEQSESSDASSSYSYEDEVEPATFSELPDVSHQLSQYLYDSLNTNFPQKDNLHTSNARNSTLQIADTEKPHSRQHYCETMGTAASRVDQDHKNGRLNFAKQTFSRMHVTFKSNVTKCNNLSERLDDGNLSGCWPLGVLLKNPFDCDMKHKVAKPHEFRPQKCDVRMETLEEEETDFDEIFLRFNTGPDATGKIKMNEATLSSRLPQSWCPSYDLSVNPILAKTAWLRTVRNVKEKGLISNNGHCFPYFDFSSVSDLRKGYSESIIASHGHESLGTGSKFVASLSATKVNENSGRRVQDNVTDQSVLSSKLSPRERNDKSGVLPTNASGGSGWEALLNYQGENDLVCEEDEWCDSVETFEAPVDIIIDKCILQEILIQYKYVSNFAIKLLKEGFDLHEHLVALRRYHFMEQADWADSFIISLCNQTWSMIEPEQKIPKIQGLLDLALQRSSCGSDPHKERLFVYAEGQNAISQPISAIGLHAFNFLVLGYRVDWPINIIITQDALKTYAEIFNCLIQIRLAVISLTDVWHWLKVGMHLTKRSQSTRPHKTDFTMLTKMRQQINHFVHTLQVYVHSHLSDVSWCQFQNSLQRRVKDMMDLESVHKSYLADALHICFLSAEMKPIASIIKNILQCALDFRLCFPGSCLVDVQSDGKDPLDLQCQINFSQVIAVKTTFERNIKDLYILYLKSPKHGEFSLYRFWSYLNFNEYYSVAIAKEMGCL